MIDGVDDGVEILAIDGRDEGAVEIVEIAAGEIVTLVDEVPDALGFLRLVILEEFLEGLEGLDDVDVEEIDVRRRYVN